MLEMLAVPGMALIVTYLVSSLVHPRLADRLLLACAGEEDEDIKIADGPFTTRPREDLAEQAAQQFLRQKEAGNIDRARRLGRIYAQAIIGFEKEPPPSCGEHRTQLEVHHQLLLCSFVINRVIGDHSPNSILARTTLNVFYSALEEESPALRQHVSDMAAFSLYILCERSRRRSEQDIGETYARLCGFEGESKQIEEGNRIFQEFHRYCVDQMEQVGYVETI